MNNQTNVSISPERIKELAIAAGLSPFYYKSTPQKPSEGMFLIGNDFITKFAEAVLKEANINV